MQVEYERSILELNNLQMANTDGAGDDQADAGSKTFEREQEQSIAANRHDLLVQIEHAIERIDAGTYGICENCGRPIPEGPVEGAADGDPGRRMQVARGAALIRPHRPDNNGADGRPPGADRQR